MPKTIKVFLLSAIICVFVSLHTSALASTQESWTTSIISKPNAEITNGSYFSIGIPYIGNFPGSGMGFIAKQGDGKTLEAGFCNGFFLKYKIGNIIDSFALSAGGEISPNIIDGYKATSSLNTAFLIADFGNEKLKFTGGIEALMWPNSTIWKPYAGLVAKPSNKLSLLAEIRIYNSLEESNGVARAISPNIGARLFLFPNLAIESGLLFVPKQTGVAVTTTPLFFTAISLQLKDFQDALFKN